MVFWGKKYVYRMRIIQACAQFLRQFSFAQKFALFANNYAVCFERIKNINKFALPAYAWQTYYQESVYFALLLAIRNLVNFLGKVRMQQAVDALWKCIYHQRPIFWNQAQCISIFCVRLLQFARSTLPGNTRASDSGTSNLYGLSRFLFITPFLMPKRRVRRRKV